MSGNQFNKHVDNANYLLQSLIKSERYIVSKCPKFEQKTPAIYVFYKDGEAVYVGRTRNLYQRLKDHTRKNRFSASFALKNTRIMHKKTKAYGNTSDPNKMTSKDIVETYAETFQNEVEKIKLMEFCFIKVKDPLDQYILELLATLHFKLPTDGFDTH